MKLALVVTAALVVTGLGPIGSSSAAPTICDGQPVTITGDLDERVTGTPGDDVIVTNGAPYVDALAGNDRICVTGRSPSSASVSVWAGQGNDRVIVLLDNPGVNVRADLGDGADEFHAGATDDFVDAAGENVMGASAVVDDDVDRIETGANHDSVAVGSSGVDVADVVDLGSGNDWLHVRGPPTHGHSFDAGPGSDFLHPGRPRQGAGRLVFDNVQQEARLDGVQVHQWDRFESFSLFSSPDRPAEFIGGPSDEWVAGETLARADMGAGDDYLLVGAGEHAPGGVPPQAPYDGGTGRDRLAYGEMQDDLSVDGTITADLVRKSVEFESNGVREVVELRRMEDLRLWADVVTLRGNDRANTLHAYGCTVTMVGRGGADVLASPPRFDNVNDCLPGMTMRGGPGTDRLIGRAGDDRLIGGTGRDRADGNGGRDLCRAEVLVDCERR